MPSNIRKLLGFILIVIFISGCSYKAKSYVMVKERIDQEDSGNAGYLKGDAPAVEDDAKKTRKVYVLEFTEKNKAENPDKAVIVESPKGPEGVDVPVQPILTQSQAQASQQKVNVQQIQRNDNVSLPSFDTLNDDPTEGTVSFEEYKVTKDDTLQKIAKKFYDSYSKWTKIYEANKDRIKDPNRIKPGMTLKIPVE